MNWPREDSLPLGSVCEINPGFPREARPNDADLVSFVPMAAVNEVSASIAAAEVRPYSAVKKGFTPFRENDVLFAKITPCMENGKIALAKELRGGIGFGSTEFHVLRASARVLPEWLRYFVLRPSFRMHAKRQMSGAVGQQRVSADFLSNSQIVVPPLVEQRRLVDLLSRAENIVRMRREASRLAKEIIPALFLDMFGSGFSKDDVEDEGRRETDRAAPSSVNTVKEWPIVTLGALFSEKPNYGTMIPARPELLPWLCLRVANIQGGQLALTDKKYVSLPEDAITRHEVLSGDILMARAIGSLDHLGKLVVANVEGGRWAFDSHLMRIRLRGDRIEPIWLKAFLSSDKGRRRFLEKTRRTAVQFNINTKEMASIRVPLPPIELQRAFVGSARRVFELELQQGSAAAIAEHAFRSLLANVFG